MSQDAPFKLIKLGIGHIINPTFELSQIVDLYRILKTNIPGQLIQATPWKFLNSSVISIEGL